MNLYNPLFALSTLLQGGTEDINAAKQGPGMMDDPMAWLEANKDSILQDILAGLGTLVVAILIFIVGRWVSRIIVNLVRQAMGRAKLDDLLVDFVSSIIGGILVLFVVIAALGHLGINTSSFVALVGAAGLAVGFALQDSLQNFASGVMLIIFRPFKNGDFIEAGGVTGVVERIQIFSTIMKTGDNREIIVPNGGIFGSAITNFSARATRRVDMLFGIGYDDDLLKAKAILNRLVLEDDRILAEPAPVVAINDLGDSSVNFKVRPWVSSGDYWDVLSDFTEKVKLTFDQEGISIPYPQMDVHVNQVNAS